MKIFKNILVIRQSALGDVANIFPLLRIIRKAYPAAKLTCLTGALTSGLLAKVPEVDNIITFNRTKKPLALLSIFNDLRSRHFDLVVDLQSSKHSRWLTWATRAGIRLGRGKNPFYTHPVKYDPTENQACESFLKIIAPLDIPSIVLEPYFPQLKRCVAQARQFLSAQRVELHSIAVLNPGHSPEWKTKRWPLAHWVVLAQLFLEFGLTPVITGGAGEVQVADEIVAATHGRAVSTAGRTSLEELAGIMALAKVVISTDSGPMHVAAMTGTPVVALFGPTNPVPSAPLGAQHRILHRKLHCSLCFKKICPYNHECLDQLKPETVWREVESILVSSARFK